jgi:hypothetical protein
MKDLIVLAADKSLQLVVRSLLMRSADLGLREISFDVVVHIGRDPGVCLDAHNFLRPLLRRYSFALAICDHEGSGQETRSREHLEEGIERKLSANGWVDRAAAIVIEPELESWIWGDWRASAQALNWRETQPLKDWLIEKNLLDPNEPKPREPKEALQSAVRHCGKGWSSAVHQKIAGEARFESCIDTAFLKLRSVLRNWFQLDVTV